jgi:predicted dehydrogenase
MSAMKEVRLGIVGVGVMGSFHAKNLLRGKVSRCRLAAVCDINPKQMEIYGPEVSKFSCLDDLLASKAVDAILVSTPHYNHTISGIQGLKRGVHVLIEKPLSVTRSACEKIIKTAAGKKKLFAMMFNQRTDPSYRKIKELIDGGALGKMLRMNWIVTDWFRTNAYYRGAGWRATWEGEGGGVLINQAAHQMDLLTWMCGMPTKVRAFCHRGKYHPIETEDDVTAYMEFPGGATGVFITSTGEAPGTNRLEITGENGRIVAAGNKVEFIKNNVSVLKLCSESADKYKMPVTEKQEFKFDGSGTQHVGILQNFTDAILDGVPLVAPGPDGIRSVELNNAIQVSSWTGKDVELPVKGRKFDVLIKKLIEEAKTR